MIATVPQSADAEAAYRVTRKRLSSIRPAPENAEIYGVVDPEDAEVRKLADSIAEQGLHEPLIVTEDGYLVSGHRRYTALKLIGQQVAPCRVLPVRWDSMPTDEFLKLLREHNRQRYKSVAQQVREELIDIRPDDAYRALKTLRDKSLYGDGDNNVDALVIEGRKHRCGISGQKAEHVQHVYQVVNKDRKDYWPLSVRAVHYALLNYTFYRNVPRKLHYKNDDESYQATSDLITRMRLNGQLPWHAFDDGTRPLQEFRAFSDVRQYVRQEVNTLFTGYWRDLLQTQPCHVEVVCEKNTIYHMVVKKTRRYQIPTSSGRGFNSIDPWHDLYLRFKRSKKDRLVVIILSDFDPEGEMIPQVGGRTLRDDFRLPWSKFDIIKAGVTEDQIENNRLPSANFAKESSSNYQWFLDRNDGDDSVYELEALNPAVMLADLETVIESVLDVDLFNREVEIERQESAYIEAARKSALEALKGLLTDGAQ